MPWQSALLKDEPAVAQLQLRDEDLPHDMFAREVFTRQISLADDPDFWWRLALTGQRIAQVTDFKPGRQSDALMGHCLAVLLDGVAQPDPLPVEFIDLVPRALDPAQHRIALTSVAQRVERWISSAALSLGTQAQDPVLEQRGDKTCMLTRFDPWS